MANSNKSPYAHLAEHLEELTHLGSVMGIMHWDQEVMMPSGGTESRALQLSALAGVLHDKSTDPLIEEWLHDLEDNTHPDLDPYERCNVQEARRNYDRETKLPKSLVQELAELSSRGHQIWAKARQENRFSDFEPVLARLVELKEQYAQCIDPAKPAYDVNMDDYERGFTMEKVDALFGRLKEALVPLIQRIQSSDHVPDTSFLQGHFPIELQESLGSKISRDMGFDFDKGRMDVSVHPFCGGGDSTDVRITTRYREDNFVESLYGVIHETGHALYEQGRLEEYRHLPVSEARSMGVHESQSLFWERMIAQQESFCTAYFPLIAETFPGNFKAVTSHQLYRAINLSQPSFIRVEADEVTYPMHVILRYEIEKGLFDGSLSVEQLPEVWNSKMEQYLGIRPPTDTLGVLQDVHWSGGSFGYFPSYTLGAMISAQLYETMKRDIPEVEDWVSQRSFAGICDWLRKNIHSRGKLYSTEDLLEKVTGEPLNPEFFISYLVGKYEKIYQPTD